MTLTDAALHGPRTIETLMMLQGMNRRDQGYDVTDCPWGAGTRDEAEWLAGWWRAEAEHRAGQRA